MHTDPPNPDNEGIKKRSSKSVAGRLPPGGFFDQVIRDTERVAQPSTPPEDPSDSSSSSSSSSEENSSSDDESEAAVAGPTRRHASHRRKKSRMIIKPIPPNKYNGSADSDQYLQFLHESTQYLKLGRVDPEDQVLMLGYYVEGKARTFFNRKARPSKSIWTLQDFFIEMLKFCFPPDFRMKQRDRLNRCYQNNKSVTDHIAEF
jgi:hypothetical protein